MYLEKVSVGFGGVGKAIVVEMRRWGPEVICKGYGDGTEGGSIIHTHCIDASRKLE